MATLVNPQSERRRVKRPEWRDSPAPNPLHILIWPVLALAIVLPLFCHGCHGDEDTELFISAQEKSPRRDTVGYSNP
jgi:hypothetical protein